MKYLIMEDFSGQPICFVFPRRVDHADMRDQLPYGKVLSAGFTCLVDGAYLCTGGSQELACCARDEDSKILLEAFRVRE